mgnify:CR=1 FL=1
MEKQLFLGDEAIAQAAIDAGISGVYAYPGTPSTEITEYIQGSAVAKERGIHSRWSTNEKTAMEAALGMSYAGKRSLCCMKHVGLNVAADCFMNAVELAEYRMAYYSLGLLYFKGQGVDRSLEKAVYYARKALVKGAVIAQELEREILEAMNA